MSKARLARYTHFVSAVYRLLRDGTGFLSEEQIGERLAICNECEHFTGHKCRKCGCCTNGRVTLLNKLAHPAESCPEDKWPKIHDLGSSIAPSTDDESTPPADVV
jgi:hypothetical protein